MRICVAPGVPQLPFEICQTGGPTFLHQSLGEVLRLKSPSAEKTSRPSRIWVPSSGGKSGKRVWAFFYRVSRGVTGNKCWSSCRPYPSAPQTRWYGLAFFPKGTVNSSKGYCMSLWSWIYPWYRWFSKTGDIQTIVFVPFKIIHNLNVNLRSSKGFEPHVQLEWMNLSQHVHGVYPKSRPIPTRMINFTWYVGVGSNLFDVP